MLRAGQVIQLVVIALLCLAVVMVTSAGLSVTGASTSLHAVLWNRTAVLALAAVLAMFLGSRIDLRWLRDARGWWNPVFWVLAAALALVALTWLPTPLRVTYNGAHRWLRLGPIQFQPSELVKWGLVLGLALWCTRRQSHMGWFKAGLLPPLILLGVACLLIVKEDLGTAALIAMVAVILLLAGGARWWHLALLVPPAAGGLVLAIASSHYRRARLTSFLDPWSDPLHTGYQAIQSMVTIAQGGLWGRGLGNGIQKFGYLPVDTSDCLYAVICEELGMPGAALVVGLYLLLLWFGFKIVRRCTDPFSRLVALGVVLMIGLQALINLAVVTVVVPTKGIALPLLSAGGTGWIVTAFAIGLVAGIDRAAGTEQAATMPDASPEPAPVTA